MFKKISYIFFFLVMGFVALFMFITNQKLEKQKTSPEPKTNNQSPKDGLSEKDRVHVIFENELGKEKTE
jgi:energy-converting hydrogenase Eha subunit F